MDFFSSGWFYVLAALGFGFVIFIHELGHFLFAKWAGVKVERFSIGFGPVIFKKTVGETEYALSLLPLGGYVKMLGQEDLPADIPEEVKLNPRSYLAVGPLWQAAILLAGVLFNLVSSYAILLGIAWHGMPVVEPVVGGVVPTINDIAGKPHPSPAVQLGLHQGDRILTFNGKRLRSFDDLSMAVVTAGTDPVELEVARRGDDGRVDKLVLPQQGGPITVAPDFASGRPTLGVEFPKGWRIDLVKAPAGTAPANTLQPGDRLVAIDGRPLEPGMIGQQVEDLLRPLLGHEVTLTVDPGHRDVKLRYAGGFQEADLAYAFPMRIESVVPGSSAEAAGLKPGDLPIKVDGQELGGSSHFISLTRAAMNQGREFSVTVLRDGAEQTFTLKGKSIDGRTLVGAGIAPVEGYLPIVPKAYDGKESPLELAGIKPGDAIVDRTQPKPGDENPQLELLVVSGGQRQTIALPVDDVIAIKKGAAPPALFKLLGASGTPSIISQLAGMRVENTGDGHGYPDADFVQVADRDGAHRSVSLRALSPAARAALLAGLKPGDWITGMTVVPSGDRALEVVRGVEGAPRTVQVKPKDIGTALVLGVEMHTYELHGWTEAFSIANDAAYNMVVKTLQIIPRFFRSTADGGIDANKSLTGPIGIFSALKGSAERFGFDSYLSLLALIGLNLFLVNLLPIPVTDGGQLLFLAIETITRRPLPAAARNVASWIGVIMVMGLMLYVIGLDILRYAGAL